MKVLVLNFEKSWRGGERQTLYNMIGYRNEGAEVALLCRANSPLANRANKEGFKVYSFSNVFNVLFFLLSKGRNYDIMHVQAAHILTYVAFTKFIHRCKVVFTRRVNFQPHGFFTRLKYQLSDRVVAISQSVKRVLHNFGLREVALVSDIVVPKQLNAVRAREAIAHFTEGKKIIATMAALTQDKDPLTTVEAIKQLKEKRNDFVFLHFGAGDMKAEVEQKIIEYDLEDCYKMVGFHDDVEDFFSQLDVFIMTSEQEGLGSIVLDAFAYKVPVVATKAGGMAELVEEGRGLGCEIGDAKELAESVNTLLNDKVLTNDVIENAYNYVIEEHSMEAITKKYIDIFKNL